MLTHYALSSFDILYTYYMDLWLLVPLCLPHLFLFPFVLCALLHCPFTYIYHCHSLRLLESHFIEL